MRKVLISIPCFTGGFSSEFTLSLLDLVIESMDSGIDVEVNVINRARVERARNDFLIDAIEKDADILFLDDDVLVEPSLLKTLIESQKPIAIAPVKDRKGGDGLILLGEDLKWIKEVKEPVEIFSGHMGASFIKNEVLRAVKERYMRPFEFGNTEVNGSMLYLSEDTTFCLRADALGFKTWAVPAGETTHLGDFQRHVYIP